jgi:biopolymer transport protein TolQ
MIPLLAALQATAVEPLPEDAVANTVQTAATAAPAAANNGLDVLQLVMHASIPVQLVLLLLLFASIASWVIIFRKKRVLDRAEREAIRFEERFWSGAELSKLYSGATERNRDIGGLEAIFEGGFREFNRIRHAVAWIRACSWKVRNGRCARRRRANSMVSNTTSNSSPTSVRSARTSACSARCGGS